MNRRKFLVEISHQLRQEGGVSIPPLPRPPQTPHPVTPFPSSLSPGEREEGEGSWGEGSCRPPVVSPILVRNSD
jgi:hypothetical protein